MGRRHLTAYRGIYGRRCAWTVDSPGGRDGGRLREKGDHMRYIEYRIYAAEDELDELAGLLELAGAGGLSINDPREAEIFSHEPHGFLWDYVDESVLKELSGRPCVSFYLKEGEALSPGLEALIRGRDVSRTLLDDEDWLHKWEEYYVPLRLSPHIVAKPVWRDYEPKEGDIVVEIDPGMAFGTGSSPTSYLSVRLMERFFEPCREALDIGCGTGILTVIAAKLGAEHISSCDLDPEALKSTEANVKLNGCADIVDISKSDLGKGMNVRADAVLANLTAELVVRLCGHVRELCAPGALFISSGIIDDKEKLCAEAIEAAGFEIVGYERDAGWTAIAARLR